MPNLSRLAIRSRSLLALSLSLLIALAVTIAMAALLPTGAERTVRVDAIAAALRGTGDAVLMRRTSPVPPLPGARWLDAPGARRQLAAILRVPVTDVHMIVAAPVKVRPMTTQTALADRTPVRAAFLPFAQDTGSAPAAPPVIVVTPPPPAAAAPTPAPRPAAPVARDVPARTVPPARTTTTARTTPPARNEPARPATRAQDAPRVAPQAAAVRPPVPSTAPIRAAPAAPVVAVPVQSPVPAAAPSPLPPVPVVPPPVVTAPVAPAPVTTAIEGPGPIQEISGEFRAALRLPAGGWTIVRPRPETFPTTDQQRMILWFLVAMAVTLPVAWVLALMLERPLLRFANAAERSGREPGYALPSVGIPAELAPALAALTRLQTRAQSLEGDRAAFAGTLRNELRAPLERLRAGLDDAPRQIREAFHDDLTDIEEAVAALQLFLDDAGIPTALRRRELGDMVRVAAGIASESGEPVVAEVDQVVWVEADYEAIGRLFEHLIAYTRRQGGTVTMRLSVEGDDAIVDMADSDRPDPAGFAPGLHGKAERAGTVRPSGPGLAVARSIARTHGGEVLLVRSDRGMTARLRLPIADR